MRIFLSGLILVSLIGCSHSPTKTMLHTKQALAQEARIGMSVDEVDQLLAPATPVRVEQAGGNVEIRWYAIEFHRSLGGAQPRSTPIVIKDGKLWGIGEAAVKHALSGG